MAVCLLSVIWPARTYGQEARGINELLFSLSHVKADSLSLPITKIPLIFSGYRPVKEFRPQLDTLTFTHRRKPSFQTDNTLARRVAANEMTWDALATYMARHPERIEYLAWTLPEPPTLPTIPDRTSEFIIADIPDAVIEDGELELQEFDIIHRTNWLHKFDGGVQFSQAYLSPNWYQGGTNNITLLINLLWEVRLNEVYHPNLLFESTMSYKLGLYSTPQDSLHKYSISEDLFQYNMKFGVRAKNKFFYSLTTQFKTQFLNNYAENSAVRKAAFLSPGELNFGLGMTYASDYFKKRCKLNVSLAPFSYNLKTCINHAVDPTLFSIPEGKRSHSQFGSNAEVTLQWQLAQNISWRSRLFLFTNYDEFQGDWENTFNFSINKFLSTQIYLHMRYDTATEAASAHWRHWMLKEILSFGFRYAFSTK